MLFTVSLAAPFDELLSTGAFSTDLLSTYLLRTDLLSTDLLSTAVQVSGSLLVLVPFVLVQFRRVSASSRTYLILNVAGSAVLAADALLGAQWGFLLLESVWALVSLVGLLRTFRSTARRTHSGARAGTGTGTGAGTGVGAGTAGSLR